MVPTTGFEPVNLYGADLESDAFGRSATSAVVIPHIGEMIKGLWKGRDLSPRVNGIKCVLVLTDDRPGNLDQLGKAAQNTHADQFLHTFLRIDGISELPIATTPVTTPGTEGEPMEFFIDEIHEIFENRVCEFLVAYFYDDISRLSIVNKTLSVRNERFYSKGLSSLDLGLVTGIERRDRITCMKIPMCDLMSAEVLDNFEAIPLDAHLDGTANLTDGDTGTDELRNSVPGTFGRLDKFLVSIGTYLDGSSGVSDVSVKEPTAVHLDDIADTEAGLIIRGWGVVSSDLVYTEVAGKCKTTAMITDISFDLLCDVEQFRTRFAKAKAEFPSFGGHTARFT